MSGPVSPRVEWASPPRRLVPNPSGPLTPISVRSAPINDDFYYKDPPAVAPRDVEALDTAGEYYDGGADADADETPRCFSHRSRLALAKGLTVVLLIANVLLAFLFASAGCTLLTINLYVIFIIPFAMALASGLVGALAVADKSVMLSANKVLFARDGLHHIIPVDCMALFIMHVTAVLANLVLAMAGLVVFVVAPSVSSVAEITEDDIYINYVGTAYFGAAIYIILASSWAYKLHDALMVRETRTIIDFILNKYHGTRNIEALIAASQ